MNTRNLKPFQTGYDLRRVGNGRPRGSKSLSTLVKNTLEKPLNWSLIPIKNQEFQERYKGKVAAEVIVYTAVALAIEGDIKAMAWLSKTAYGDKVDATPERLPIPILGGTSILGISEVSDEESNFT
jgi:hypothetical protein